MTQAVLGQCVHGNETGTDSEAQFVTWGVWPAGRSEGCQCGVEMGKVKTERLHTCLSSCTAETSSVCLACVLCITVNVCVCSVLRLRGDMLVLAL